MVTEGSRDMHVKNVQWLVRKEVQRRESRFERRVRFEFKLCVIFPCCVRLIGCEDFLAVYSFWHHLQIFGLPMLTNSPSSDSYSQTGVNNRALVYETISSHSIHNPTLQEPSKAKQQEFKITCAMKMAKLMRLTYARSTRPFKPRSLAHRIA